MPLTMINAIDSPINAINWPISAINSPSNGIDYVTESKKQAANKYYQFLGPSFWLQWFVHAAEKRSHVENDHAAN